MYTTDQIKRCSKISGTFQKEVRGMLKNVTLNSPIPYDEQSHRSPKHDKDVQKFIKDYTNDELFSYCPPRNHNAFPEFKHECELKSPYKLGVFLQKQSQTMDKWKAIANKSKKRLDLNKSLS